MVALFELPLTGWTRRFHPARTMAVGYVLLGGGFALNACGHSFAWLFTAMTIFTIGEIISVPVSNAYVARLAPEPMRGRYLGTLAIAWNLAGVAGPFIGFYCFQIEPIAVWVACGVLGLLSAASILRAPARGDAPIVGVTQSA